MSISGTYSQFAVALIAALFLFAGCKEENGQTIDYGPQSADSVISDKLNEAVSHQDPLQIQKGQFVDFDQTQMVAQQMFSVTAEIGKTVIDRDDTSQPEYVLYTIVQKQVDYSSNRQLSIEMVRAAAKNPKPQAKPVQAKIEAQLMPSGSYKQLVETAPSATLLASAAQDFVGDLSAGLLALDPSPTPAPTQTPVPSPSPDPNADQPPVPPSAPPAQLPASAPAKTKVTYHNLVIRDLLVPAPDKVAAQANCGGIAGCQLHEKKFEFDMVIWPTDGSEPQKVHREFWLSPDVPFFARVMNQCDTLLVPVSKTKTLVTLCSTVRNFRWN